MGTTFHPTPIDPNYVDILTLECELVKTLCMPCIHGPRSKGSNSLSILSMHTIWVSV